MKPKGASSLTESENLPLEEDELRSMRSASPHSVCADSLFSSQSTVDTMALNKITALEDELARLRDQIAKIVTAGTGPPGTSGINCQIESRRALVDSFSLISPFNNTLFCLKTKQ